MNLPSFPDLNAEIKQAALRSPRTWAAPLAILLLFFSGRLPLPEVSALLFVSILVQLTLWYRHWHTFETAARRRILERHSRQFESALARENQKQRNPYLERALKSYQTISAGNCRSEQLSAGDFDLQQRMEDQIRALAEIVCNPKHPTAQTPAADLVETAAKTLEKLAAIRQKTLELRVKQGLADESELVENPLEKLQRTSEQLQHQAEVEEEMQKLVSRVQDTPNPAPPKSLS